MNVWISLGKRSLSPFVSTDLSFLDRPRVEKARVKKPLPTRNEKPIPVIEVSCSDSDSDDNDQPMSLSLSSGYKPRTFHPKIEELKQVFMKISREDTLDLGLYKNLDDDQKKVVDAIFVKRYKPEIVAAISLEKNAQMPIFEYLVKKRMDHCEKTSMSLRLSILREKFKEVEYGDKRPKDLHDEINKLLFKKYFDTCIDSEEPVEISKNVSGTGDLNDKSKYLPRRSAIFCMKKGLTKCWFRSISSKFLSSLMKIKVEDLKKYYFERFVIKLDEIFGPTNDYLEGYYETLINKIQNKKFKLPLTSKELEFCDSKAVKKINKLKKYTEAGEKEDFRFKYGENRYLEKYNAWIMEPETRSSSIVEDK